MSQDKTAPSDENILLEWTCHPMKRRPAVTVAVSLFVLLLVILVYVITSSRLFAVLAIIILAASLAKFYFPTVYRIGDKRIMIKTTTQTLYKDWSLYRSCYPDKNGILVSPFAGPSRLENFRGLYLMFENNRDSVVEVVKAQVALTLQREDASRRDKAGQTSGDTK